MIKRPIASVRQVSTAPLRLVTIDDRAVQLPGGRALPAIETEAQLRDLLAGLAGVDAVGAEARAAKLATRSLKKSTKLAALDLAISMVDLTTLEGADRPGTRHLALREGGAPRRERPERAERGGGLRLSRPRRSRSPDAGAVVGQGGGGGDGVPVWSRSHGGQAA